MRKTNRYWLQGKETLEIDPTSYRKKERKRTVETVLFGYTFMMIARTHEGIFLAELGVAYSWMSNVVDQGRKQNGKESDRVRVDTVGVFMDLRSKFATVHLRCVHFGRNNTLEQLVNTHGDMARMLRST